MKMESVQSERKPFDVQREKPSNCAASTEKIYIRKDLRSPLIATPTFVADKDGTRQTGLLDPGMLVNIQQPLIREDGTVLLATDSKVMLCLLLDLSVAVQTASLNVCTHLLVGLQRPR